MVWWGRGDALEILCLTPEDQKISTKCFRGPKNQHEVFHRLVSGLVSSPDLSARHKPPLLSPLPLRLRGSTYWCSPAPLFVMRTTPFSIATCHWCRTLEVQQEVKVSLGVPWLMHSFRHVVAGQMGGSGATPAENRTERRKRYRHRKKQKQREQATALVAASTRDAQQDAAFQDHDNEARHIMTALRTATPYLNSSDPGVLFRQLEHHQECMRLIMAGTRDSGIATPLLRCWSLFSRSVHYRLLRRSPLSFLFAFSRAPC